jgi:4a-hydroxytetrahydrobiopterin dehydratase
MNIIKEIDLKHWLSEHQDWEFIDDQIVLEAEFEDFVTAFGFLTSVGILAEKHNHHPTMENAYNLVRISMNTHDADDKITDRDLNLAEAIDKL